MKKTVTDRTASKRKERGKCQKGKEIKEKGKEKKIKTRKKGA